MISQTSILNTFFFRDSNNFRGFPVSDYLNNNFLNLKLSYEAREIACHAIEVYIKRLKDNDYEYLKIHSYRAALEEIIVHCWPNLKHCGLRSVKHTEGLSFEEYGNIICIILE